MITLGTHTSCYSHVTVMLSHHLSKVAVDSSSSRCCDHPRSVYLWFADFALPALYLIKSYYTLLNFIDSHIRPYCINIYMDILHHIVPWGSRLQSIALVLLNPFLCQCCSFANLKIRLKHIALNQHNLRCFSHCYLCLWCVEFVTGVSTAY